MSIYRMDIDNTFWVVFLFLVFPSFRKNRSEYGGSFLSCLEGKLSHFEVLQL